MAHDPVPEADRLEQEMPPARDERSVHRVTPDATEADVYEQELPLAESLDRSGIDAERSEPISDDEWAATPGAS